MSDTTRVQSHAGTVRLKPRYWFMLLLIIMVPGVWPTWHLTIRPQTPVPALAAGATPSRVVSSAKGGAAQVEANLGVWQALGMFCVLLGAAVFVIATMDRLRTGRGRSRAPTDGRIAEAYQVARANFVLSLVQPMAVAVALLLPWVPAPILRAFELAARWLFPNLPSHL